MTRIDFFIRSFKSISHYFLFNLLSFEVKYPFKLLYSFIYDNYPNFSKITYKKANYTTLFPF